MLEIDAITLHYGAAQALKSVSCTATPGQVTTVLGRNGVGKSSLLRAVVGRHPISGGAIRWQGKSIAGLSSADRAARGIAYVPQGREIFPLLKDMLGRRGGDLSGGQQQQLAIGRAMVMRPSLLVLDEPTEGIQPSIIKDIGRAIAFLRDQGHMAILLVEQYFDFARDLADTFCVMDRGEVVMSGTGPEMSGPREPDLRRWLTV